MINASCSAPPAVDLVVNVFERTYRALTAPEAFAALARSHRFPFARRVLLVNNILDRRDAHARVDRLLDSGEIDAAYFVADHLDRALHICGLERSELEPLLHYCDAPLVAVTLPGSPWLLYWDAEATLDAHTDWVTPACAELRHDPRLLIANPSWERPRTDGARPGVDREASEVRGDFAIGHGFSDQAFLARRADLAGPIYRRRCIVRIVHPRAHKGTTFEPRIHAHMRHNGLLRATYLGASFSIDQPEGARARRPAGALEWARYLRNGALLRATRRSPWRPHCLRHTWIAEDHDWSRSGRWSEAARRLRRRMRSSAGALERPPRRRPAHGLAVPQGKPAERP